MIRRRLLGAAAAALLPVLLAPGAGWAHAFLLHANPAVGSMVDAAPKEVRIDFTGALEPSFSAISVVNQTGATVDKGDSHPEGADAMAVTLQPLPPGRYAVRWHVVSVDTHRTEGGFEFTVAPTR